MPPGPLRVASYLDKGGTGKSTTVAHIAAALAGEGHKPLAIDLAGKQGDLAKIFGVHDEIDDDDWPNIATVFQPEWAKVAERIEDKFGEDPLAELVVETDEGVDLIPAHEGLDSLDVELETKYDGAAKYEQLDRFLTDYVDDKHDVVLIDLPGAPNNVTYNGVWAAQHVIAPVRAGLLEAEQAEALGDDLARFRENLGREVELTMLLPTMIDQRTNLAQQFLEQYEAEYPDALAPEPIPDSQGIPNATAQGRTVFAVEDDELLKTARRAREAYRTDAVELITRLSQ